MTRLISYSEIADDFIAVSSKNELFTITAAGTQSVQIRSVEIDEYFSATKTEFGISPSGRHFLIDKEFGAIPTCIQVDDKGNVYVAFFDDTLRKYDSDFNEIWRVGGEGSANGQFDYIVDMTIMGDYIYIADQNNDRIQKYDLSGNYILTVDSSSDLLVDISGICNDGTSLFVVDKLDFNVKRYENDTWQESFGTFGTGTGNFNFATGCAMKSDGRMVIADTENDRLVLLYTYPFSWNSAIGVAGTAAGQLKLPQYVELDDDQNFYVNCQEFSFPVFTKFDLQAFNSSFVYIETMADGITDTPYSIDVTLPICVKDNLLYTPGQNSVDIFSLSAVSHTMEIQNIATKAGDYEATITLTEQYMSGDPTSQFTIPLSVTLDSFTKNTYDLKELGKSRIIQQYRI